MLQRLFIFLLIFLILPDIYLYPVSYTHLTLPTNYMLYISVLSK